MSDLKLKDISKAYRGVTALQNVSLQILPGEIHALCGENGAGKSTLMNVLSGNVLPDQGEILINDKHVTIDNPAKAFSLGISIVHQHLSLVESLSIAENIFANSQPTNKFGFIRSRLLYEQTDALLKELTIDYLKPDVLVARLSPAQKQMIEIAKALARNPSILILDEPTASLTDSETKILFEMLQTIKAKGVSVIYISHRLDEVYRISDRISILKDGKYQGTFLTKDLSRDELIRRMVGREIRTLNSNATVRTETLMSVDNISGKGFSKITFTLKKGEILGFAGLVGAGRTEMARAIIGIDKRTTGNIAVNGERVNLSHPAEAILHGLAYLPEDRKRLGLFNAMPVYANVHSGKLSNATLSSWYDDKQAKNLASDSVRKLRIATPDVQQKVLNLSGGNQQKVVLAKWLLTDPEILVVDEPTHGIDVGAKFEVYEILQSLAADGKGIIMISSELPELLALCDRIIVMKRGEITGELSRGEATEEKILSLAAN